MWDLPKGTLRWVQHLPPREKGKFLQFQFQREAVFELKDGDEIFATLESRGAWVKGAVGYTADAAFGFTRKGFFKPSVVVRRPELESDLALFEMSPGGSGTLLFPDGRHFDFYRHGIWRPEWGFADWAGTSLCRFAMTGRLLKWEAQLSLDVEPRSFPDLPLLMILGMYVIVLALHQTSSTGDMGTAGDPG